MHDLTSIMGSIVVNWKKFGTTEKLHATRAVKISLFFMIPNLSAIFDRVYHKTILSISVSIGDSKAMVCFAVISDDTEGIHVCFMYTGHCCP